ncbi:hypothetical protein POM88_025210 [Heracleum sosnowskyi]|uniref:Endonuclease/exonuclease/phosphatase domain-containing protein n=1 Tax=Heracleum sosnowskyi TaxID=360622 RepID=A0AAD8MM78_9APIA|nr:hypothetical protein POM88_025210 [Heracleum sosnowskyi]
MGDFNEILSQEDKEGGGTKSDSQIEAFRMSLEICALQPLDYHGTHFTWSRNTVDGCIKERLDWAIANEEWVECFPNNRLTHLDFFHSDHRALYLCLQDSTELSFLNRKRKRFRFENIWVREPDCQDIITASWKTSDQSALLLVIDNIKECTLKLASWNQSKFGSLAKDIKQTHKRIIALREVQDQIDNIEELKKMERKLNDLLYKEEVFWKQRSRVLWPQQDHYKLFKISSPSILNVQDR